MRGPKWIPFAAIAVQGCGHPGGRKYWEVLSAGSICSTAFGWSGSRRWRDAEPLGMGPAGNMQCSRSGGKDELFVNVDLLGPADIASARSCAVAGGGMKRVSIFGLLLSLWLTACDSPSVAQMAAPAEPQRSRLQIAEAMFQERCKSAGERIYRTAENVEGVFLMKVRPNEINYGDQFKMDDPYGHDSGGETYIKIFFTSFYRTPSAPPPGWTPRLGYRYVEALDPKDGKRYRYTGSKRAVGKMDANAPNVQIDLRRNPKFDLNIYAFVLEKAPAPGPAPRYGVTYDDISTREEREYWIAGSSLRVIDLRSNEVMAERIGYMMDRGQGDRGGGRSPWLLAASHACPAFPVDPGGHAYQTDQTHDFVVKALKPILEK